MARILIRLIVMAIVLWYQPTVAVVVAQDTTVIPGKADLVAFFDAHAAHGRVGWSVVRDTGTRVLVEFECVTDSSRIARMFDDERTPVWAVSADRQVAIRAVDAQAAGWSAAILIIGPRTPEAARLEPLKTSARGQGR